MLIRQFVSKGLAHYSYLVGSGPEAAVVDPRRDAGAYLEAARANGMRIMAVVETHRNEDIVSGALELSDRADAPVYRGRGAPVDYGEGLSDGEALRIGGATLRALETPGHTPHSISIAVSDEGASHPSAVLTGDTLFAGDVGRVDFLGPGRARELAGLLFDSLHERIIPLGDAVAVHPAHGKGSLCGAGIGARLSTTIGEERASNPLLALGRDEFVERKAAERLPLPPYFRRVEELNTRGPAPVSALAPPAPMGPDAVGAAMASGAQAVDGRSPGEFAAGHIPDSLSIGRDMTSPLAGWALDAARPVILADDYGVPPDEAWRGLLRIGVDSVAGHLAGGFQEWSWSDRSVERCGAYSPAALAERLGRGGAALVDVRPKPAYDAGRIRGARHAHFASAHEALGAPGGEEVAVYCASGVTASLCASLLKARGHANTGILLGGFEAWTAAGMPVELGMPSKSASDRT